MLLIGCRLNILIILHNFLNPRLLHHVKFLRRTLLIRKESRRSRRRVPLPEVLEPARPSAIAIQALSMLPAAPCPLGTVRRHSLRTISLLQLILIPGKPIYAANVL